MAQFKGLTKKKSKFLTSRLALAGLSVLTLFILYGLVGMIRKSIEAGQNEATALRQLTTFNAQAADLGAQIDKLKTDQGVEANIRDKFRVVKNGEGLTVIVDDPKSAATDPAQQDGWFVRMFKKIFN
jgi:cell division protein FtsB